MAAVELSAASGSLIASAILIKQNGRQNAEFVAEVLSQWMATNRPPSILF